MKRDRLTNEKNKNHTHIKKVGHTLEFPSGIYWWTLKNLKNQNFEIMKKKNCWRYHHFKHEYQNHNHMRDSSWNTEWDGIFCHFRPLFALSSPLTTQKTKILKKWKMHLKMSSFSTCATKTQSYDVCLLRYGAQHIIFCQFRPFFAHLPNYWPQKLNLKKM